MTKKVYKIWYSIHVLEKEKLKMSKEKNPSKSRKWFLTINEESECYKYIGEILCETENVNYSLMLHDKDNEEQPHYHLVLNYKNARTFEQIQKKFLGAHIELLASMYLSCRYLLHLDDKDKHQYDLSELITNCNEVEYYIKNDEFYKLDVETLFECIESGEVYNISSAIRKFGIRQVNIHRNLIVEVIKEKDFETKADKQNDNTYEVAYSVAQTDLYSMMEPLQNEIDRLHQQELLLNRRIQQLEEELKKSKNIFNS